MNNLVFSIFYVGKRIFDSRLIPGVPWAPRGGFKRKMLRARGSARATFFANQPTNRGPQGPRGPPGGPRDFLEHVFAP